MKVVMSQLRLHLVVADFSRLDEVADLADMLALTSSGRYWTEAKEAMRCPNGQTRNAAAAGRKPTTGNGQRSKSGEGHNE